jgi:ABC-type transport system involved in multi-copper enzyme maturation permease subunit
MSTAATYDAPRSPRTADHGRDHRPSLAQLTRVELRKTYDTRAGFWLLLSGVLLCVTSALITVFTGSDTSHTLSRTFNNSSQAINVLVPIVGILLVTSEWSQRTALLTFTMVPQRGRVLAAKIAASVVLGLLAFAAAFAVSAIAVALNPSADAAWTISGGLVAQIALFTILATLAGVGLGAAILLSAPAIVASFALPLAYTAVTHLIGGLKGLANWTDQSNTFSDLTDHVLHGQEWSQVVTTALLWIGVPLAIGAVRFVRGEIR